MTGAGQSLIQQSHGPNRPTWDEYPYPSGSPALVWYRKPVRPWTRRNRWSGWWGVTEHVAIDSVDRLAEFGLPGAAGFRCETISGGSSATASTPSGSGGNTDGEPGRPTRLKTASGPRFLACCREH